MLLGDAILGDSLLASTRATTHAPTPPPVVTPTMMGNGAWIPLQRRKTTERYTKVREEDFDSDVTPEPVEEVTPDVHEEVIPSRPGVSRGPVLPEPQTFEAPVPWTPHVETFDAQRHLARVAAVDAAIARNRAAAEARQRMHEAHVAEVQARQQRAHDDQSIMSLLLQLDDL